MSDLNLLRHIFYRKLADLLHSSHEILGLQLRPDNLNSLGNISESRQLTAYLPDQAVMSSDYPKFLGNCHARK